MALEPFARQRSARNLGAGWRLVMLAALMLALAGCSTTPSGSAGQRNVSTPTAAGAPVSGSATGTPAPRATATTTLIAPAKDWAGLEARPLLLPTVAAGVACPLTPARQGISPDYPYAQGVGPVYTIATYGSGIVPFASAASLGDTSSGYGGFREVWEIQPTYTGEVLIRGARVDRPGALEFNGGLGQTKSSSTGLEPRLSELRIDGQPLSSPSWPTWVTYTRIPEAGCYAYQVDGASFEEIIVFQAIAS
jgi:hypothetical protein